MPLACVLISQCLRNVFFNYRTLTLSVKFVKIDWLKLDELTFKIELLHIIVHLQTKLYQNENVPKINYTNSYFQIIILSKF